MQKEKNYNPVQAQRKADKAKAIKKARNERLSKKNPDRIRKQVEDLKAITEGGGKLTTHEEQVLEGLEAELKAVIKAREALGDKAPTFGRTDVPHRGHNRHDKHGGHDGRDRHDGFGRKRRRDDDSDNSTDSDVPDYVRSIPMPRDTPPPIPKRYLDDWYAKRRAKRNANANSEPLGEGRSVGRSEGRSETGRESSTPSAASSTAPPKPVEVKTVYEAKPVVRDLQKEAVSAFMPTVVRRKLEKSRGMGGLLEPEEADQLEREGYLKSSIPAASSDDKLTDSHGNYSGGIKTKEPAASQQSRASGPGAYHATVEDAEDEEG
ncbi:hypothetical protein SPBR_06056 [Sporothrix brasiliensis 5110]|uniref:Wbp11/ELF5/Saf1 N-terminal domain-containing protein n=1 Tax=Sporothrix brasiliensis 5110 TaxID=1398154 RepID=A0A0C2FUK1_9PEZI|nr:uncharacterized protein SPBR_06056 [Sporothrix brasiliensis 5110]KIH94663.1 hypothetical protein SPBR_06056 [Sporothrix brasiliensis 5110]